MSSNTVNWRNTLGRFSVDLDVTNDEDLVRARAGDLPQDQVRRVRISGVVDTGASRLVLPATVVAQLGLPATDPVTVRFADGRRDQRATVGHAYVQIQGRGSVFTAVVEPGRDDALIGAIVLEELDFIPDPTRQVLVPRDPNSIFAELD
jgi:predicted aspartyl protease